MWFHCLLPLAQAAWQPSARPAWPCRPWRAAAAQPPPAGPLQLCLMARPHARGPAVHLAATARRCWVLRCLEGRCGRRAAGAALQALAALPSYPPERPQRLHCALWENVHPNLTLEWPAGCLRCSSDGWKQFAQLASPVRAAALAWQAADCAAISCHPASALLPPWQLQQTSRRSRPQPARLWASCSGPNTPPQ